MSCTYKGKLIHFIDPQGKDVGLKRWRVDLYYRPGFARTVFFDSKDKYEKFIRSCARKVYSSYSEFVQNYRR